MLDASLALSAALMGLAGTPHCLAMCGASSAAAGASAPLQFQIGRLAGYAAAGALAAASVQVLGQLGQASALLRPLWVLVHVAALLLGLTLLWRGRQPAWLMNVGQQVRIPAHALGGGRIALAKPARAGLLGLAWVAWPCGLLQSALRRIRRRTRSDTSPHKPVLIAALENSFARSQRNKRPARDKIDQEPAQAGQQQTGRQTFECTGRAVAGGGQQPTSRASCKLTGDEGKNSPEHG